MRAFGPAVWLCALAAACAPPPSDERPLEIETIEVGAPVDSELSTEEDEKGRVSGGEGWILPGDFPRDLPLLRPARLVGSGEAPGGRQFLVFHSSTEPAAAGAWFAERLPAAGWQTSGGAGALTAVREGRRVELTIEPLRPGSAIRVEY